MISSSFIFIALRMRMTKEKKDEDQLKVAVITGANRGIGFAAVEKFINELINSGADILTFHPENEQNPEKIIESIKKKSCKCGIAIHPDVKISL